MVLLESLSIPLGSKAHDFKLKCIDGEKYSLESFKDKEVLVIVFMCNHCPYVQGVIHRLIKLQDEFEDKGVQFVGINSNESDNYPEDSFEKMSEYAASWGLNFIYLRDDSQKVAKSYKAQCTPDIFVYDKKRKLAYHGRIDDNWQHEDQITQHDLKDAINNLIKDKSINSEQHPSMGCGVKWK